MRLTAELLNAVAGGPVTAPRTLNIASIVAGFDAYGAKAGLDQPGRLVHFVPQIAHESGRFVYDKEIWGNTPAQQRYETRTDLGNTPERDGDGKLFMGRTGMQLTGKANYREFRDWCWAQGLKAPDFVAEPDKVLTDPWEGLVPIWYWASRGLNRYADENNIEMVTRRINGGTNGLDDRISLFVRTALVMLGRKLEKGAIKLFQEEAGLIPDDVAGPKTRDALFQSVMKLDAAAPVPPAVVEEAESTPAEPAPPVQPAPPVVLPPVTDGDLSVSDLLTIIEACAQRVRQLTEGA